MQPGDMVRVPMGEMYHYGVCTGENRIIQFGEPVLSSPVPREQIRVGATDVASFLNGQFAEVAELDKKELKKRRPIGEIVAFAEKSLGEGGYDILYNNCEHFANRCLFGAAVSSQIEDVRREIEARMPLISVYVGEVKDFCGFDGLPRYVRRELKKITSEQARNEKTAGYGLVAFGAEQLPGKPDVKKCFLGKTGKPLHKAFCFSVSHSGGLVAAAVSAAPVGIDLEACDNPELARRILCKNEQTDDPILLWTMKEAAFKLSGKEKIFRPENTDISLFNTSSVTFEALGKRFVLTAAADVVLNLHFHSAPKDSCLCFTAVKQHKKSVSEA